MMFPVTTCASIARSAHQESAATTSNTRNADLIMILLEARSVTEAPVSAAMRSDVVEISSEVRRRGTHVARASLRELARVDLRGRVGADLDAESSRAPFDELFQLVAKSRGYRRC